MKVVQHMFRPIPFSRFVVVLAVGEYSVAAVDLVLAGALCGDIPCSSF